MRISSTGFFTSASETREFYSPVKKAGLGGRTFSFAFPLLHQGAPKRVEHNFSYRTWGLGFITHRKLSQRDISVHFSVSFVLELILHFLSICGGELALIQQVQQGSSLCQHFYHKDVVWRYPWDLFTKDYLKGSIRRFGSTSCLTFPGIRSSAEGMKTAAVISVL